MKVGLTYRYSVTARRSGKLRHSGVSRTEIDLPSADGRDAPVVLTWKGAVPGWRDSEDGRPRTVRLLGDRFLLAVDDDLRVPVLGDDVDERRPDVRQDERSDEDLRLEEAVARVRSGIVVVDDVLHVPVARPGLRVGITDTGGSTLSIGFLPDADVDIGCDSFAARVLGGEIDRRYADLAFDDATFADTSVLDRTILETFRSSVGRSPYAPFLSADGMRDFVAARELAQARRPDLVGLSEVLFRLSRREDAFHVVPPHHAALASIRVSVGHRFDVVDDRDVDALAGFVI